ncbi:MAG: TolB family protein [Acidimicrobiia bacterium]
MGRSPNVRLVAGSLVIAVLSIPGVMAAPAAAPPAAVVTALLSVASDGASANGDSFDPALSADGSTVAFTSVATNLTTSGSAGVVNVFVRDATGRTVQASDAPDGLAGDGDSARPVLSGDGGVVAFDSFAANLVSDDTNGVSDVFVRDLTSGRVGRMSVDSAGRQSNGDSFSPSISADGRFVAFASDATALVTGDHNRAGDVFVHDRRTGETSRSSVTSGGTQANGDSFSPSISADGRFVAFISEATNLVRGDTNSAADVFVHDRKTRRTTRESLAFDGRQINGGAYSPSISRDGRVVAFATVAGNAAPADDNGASDVFVRDRQTGRTRLVSADRNDRLSDRGSFAPSLSADGRFVAFVTDGALVPDDRNETEDVFLFDLTVGALRRVSVASDGSEAHQPSTGPSISGDALAIAFESLDDNLVVADSNSAQDVFWRK